MLNILLTGIGGQGTVLAAKVLAQAAQDKGWKARTAETIGMAQRGGSVVSHVRIGNNGEEPAEPLIPLRSADLIVAFEPAEAARVLPYLGRQGLLVSAKTAVQPVTTALSGESYQPDKILAYLKQTAPHFLAVDDVALCEKAGDRRVLNTILLAKALQAANNLPGKKFGITIEDLKQTIAASIKPQFKEMNLAAVDIAINEKK